MMIHTMAPAAPEIELDAYFDYLAPGKSNLLKRVNNSGSSTAFVQIAIVEELFDPKTGDISERPIVRPGSTGNTNGQQTVIASPQRLIIPVGATKSTRLLLVGDRQEERYYRVRFTPVAPTENNEFGLSRDETERYSESISAGVTVMLGYGALLTVRPDKPIYDTRIGKKKSAFYVENRGNSTILLESVQACDSSGQSCKPLPVKRIRPGRMLTLENKHSPGYRFELVEGDVRIAKVLDATTKEDSKG